MALLVLGVLVAAPANAQSPDTELRRMATQLLPRVEELSGLEAKRPIAMARRSRSQLRAYLSAELEKELASGELRNGETVYKLLELIPRNTDLKNLASELLGEQIRGAARSTCSKTFRRPGSARCWCTRWCTRCRTSTRRWIRCAPKDWETTGAWRRAPPSKVKPRW